MNFPTKSNIFGFNAASVLAAYAPFAEGAAESLLVAVSAEGPSDGARNAVARSAERVGLASATAPCAWISMSAPEGTLGASDLMQIVEGVDPLAVVALDAPSARALSAAYRCDLPLDASSCLFGRAAAVFRDLDAMLATEEGRQRAWAVLKELRR